MVTRMLSPFFRLFWAATSADATRQAPSWSSVKRSARPRVSIAVLAARRQTIDEDTALGDHAVAGRQAFRHFDQRTAGRADLDPAQLDRLVVARHPDAGGAALVDDGVAGDRDHRVALAGENLDVREHLRLEPA